MQAASRKSEPSPRMCPSRGKGTPQPRGGRWQRREETLGAGHEGRQETGHTDGNDAVCDRLVRGKSGGLRRCQEKRPERGREREGKDKRMCKTGPAVAQEGQAGEEELGYQQGPEPVTSGMRASNRRDETW